MIKILLILLMISVVVVGVIGFQNNEYKDFMQDAIEVVGVIDSKDQRDSGQKNRREDYSINYTYSVEGIVYSGKSFVEYQDLWQEADPGQQLRIYYSKSNHKKSYPAALIDRRMGIAEALKWK